ncbi:MAG: hypothetical protein V7749_16770 [Cocleimonas sp.]
MKMLHVETESQQQQKAIELCGGVVRGFTNKRGLYFRGGNLYNEQYRVPLFACYIQADLKQDSFSSLRGVTDSINMRHRFCDEKLHQSLLPDTALERFLFEMLEQLRVDCLVPDAYIGVRKNLLHRFREWSMQYHYSGLTETGVGLLIYTIAQIAWSQLNRISVLEETEDLLEATRAGIAPIIGPSLYGMKKTKHDQAAFAEHALELASKFKHLVLSEGGGEDDEDLDAIMDEIDIPDFKLLVSFDNGDSYNIGDVTVGESKAWDESDAQYKIFTTQYDKIQYAEKFIRSSFLKEMRPVLDERVSKQGINIPAIARKLKHTFATPQRDDWDYAETQGYIDGRRLSQVISSPTERRVFKNIRHQPHSDCVLSFLVDCSGSMKEHSMNVAILLDVFARAAEAAGIKTEILGFTTTNWGGGKAMKDWIKQGKPRNPGRLSGTSHMVFKEADKTWKKSRNSIAGFTKTDIYHEGVDGEAITWAAGRLADRPEQKKILTVISDGSPMDSGTNLANDDYYLDNHLKNVIMNLESSPQIEIFGLGVKLDLSNYFRYYTILHLEEQLNNATFNDILKLWLSRFK